MESLGVLPLELKPLLKKEIPTEKFILIAKIEKIDEKKKKKFANLCAIQLLK